MNQVHSEKPALKYGSKEISVVKTACALCGSTECKEVASGYDYEYATASNRFHYVECLNCSHWYLNPRPHHSTLGTIYPSDSYYAFSDRANPLTAKIRRYWEGRKVRRYAKIIGKKNARILDVGCGNGRFLSLLKEYGSPEWELVGLDIDEVAIAACREKGFDAHAGRIEDLKLDREKFDAVIMLQLIEHVENPKEVSKNVLALLKPEGVFIVETPNIDSLDHKLFKGSYWGHYHFPRHWHLFSDMTLKQMLRNVGFREIKCEFLLSVSGWIISIHNALLDKRHPRWFVEFFDFKNPLLLGLVVILDNVRALFGFKTSNQRILAKK